MKRGYVPLSDEPPQIRRPITLRESFLIVLTITALVLPNVLRLPIHSISFTDRTNTLAPIDYDSCSTFDDIATFIISCGNGETDAVAEMRPLLTSIMLLTSIPLRFIFITDDDGVYRIRRMFTSLGRTQRKVIVQILNLSEEWMKEWASQTSIDMFAHHSGVYGMSKLAAPWILTDVSLGIVLDTDMVMLKDPAMLWKEALREEGEGFEKGWVYRMMLSKEMEKASQICSCVMAMRLQKAREEKVYPELVTKVFEQNPKWKRVGVYKPPHGDQGVFFGLWGFDNRLVGNLDEVWNRDHCHNFDGLFSDGSDKTAGILHRNCYHEGSPKKNQTNDGTPPFFSFYEAYPWHWLQAPVGHGCDVEIVDVEYGSFKKTSQRAD